MAEQHLRMLAAAAVLVPLAAGLIVLILPGTLLPRLRDLAALGGAGLTLLCAAGLLHITSAAAGRPRPVTVLDLPAPGAAGLEAILPSSLDASVDRLSLLVLLAAAAAALLVLVWAWSGVREGPRRGEFLAGALWALAGTALAALADHLLVMVVGWGLAGAALLLLVTLGGDRARRSVGRTALALAAGDGALLLGAVLLLAAGGPRPARLSELAAGGGVGLTGSSGPVLSAAFLLIAAGALMRMGAVPALGWLPGAAEGAPPAAMALVPAALNLLLGGYVLARAGLFVFDLGDAAGLRALLVAAGGAAAAFGAAAALAQRNLRRLLACHLFGQAGYVAAGLGSGTAAGAGGALLHAVGTAAGMSLLFLALGAIERRTGTAELDRLGGLGRRMPHALAAVLAGSLAVSGLPLFSGFMSRWMLCSGLVEGACSPPADSPYARTFALVALLAAAALVFASVLTLASFLRVLHCAFRGRPAAAEPPGAEPLPASMRLPMYVFTLVCLALGTCPHLLVHNPFLVRIVAESGAVGWLPATAAGFALPGGGFWSPLVAALLMLFALTVLGAALALTGAGRLRTVRPPVGEEAAGFTAAELVRGAPAAAPDGAAFGLSFAGARGERDPALTDPGDRAEDLAGRVAAAAGTVHDRAVPTYLALALVGLLAVAAALLLPLLVGA